MNCFKVFIVLIAFSVQIWGKVIIPLDDKKISYDGVWFAEKSAAKVILNRHTESVLVNPESGVSIYSKPYAYTQTGIRIRFNTKSKNIYLTFEERPDAGKAGLHNAFAVYTDGKKYSVFETLSFKITSPKPDTQSVRYEVVLPSLYGVNFTGLSLDDGYTLDELTPLNKPVYAVIGTSISHGTGQQSSSFNTYPFVVSENLGWDLVNLAVAGANIGWPMAQLFKDKKVDYIGVELGFNDWMWDNKSLADKSIQYNKLLDTLRKYQKKAKIFCVTPIVTTQTTTQMSAPFRLEDFREMVRGTVQTRQLKGDTCIYIVNGDSLSSASLLDPADGVHLSETGAPKFGLNLVNKLKEIIFKPSVIDSTFRTIWEKSKSSGSLPTWFSPTGNTERGLAYGNNKLYVVSRNNGTNINILDWYSGEDIGKINVSNISGGTFLLNDVECDEDGLVYSCNLANANNEPFKIYKWKSNQENSEPQQLISYNAGTERLGDNFSVTGNKTAGIVILAASAKSDKVFRWKILNDVVSDPEIINLAAAPLLGTMPSIVPKGNGLNDGFYISSYSVAPKEYDYAGVKKMGELNNGGGVIKTLSAAKRYIIHMRPVNANLEVYSVNSENISAASVERYGATISLGNNANLNQTGDVAFRRDSNGNTVFFVLSTNNGIGAYWAKKGNDLYNGKPLITSIKEETNNTVLGDYKLFQNFPNPFNPSTCISYFIGKQGIVNIKIYDILGREVATLVNEEKQAGSYKVNFSSDGKLSSGLYFCRLITDNYNETKKMTYLK